MTRLWQPHRASAILQADFPASAHLSADKRNIGKTEPAFVGWTVLRCLNLLSRTTIDARCNHG